MLPLSNSERAETGLNIIVSIDGCYFDFSNPKILDNEPNLEKKLVWEIIEIANIQNSINKRSLIDRFLIFIKNS